MSSSLPLRALAAELLGTLVLTLAVSASIASSSPVVTPLVAGITLMMLVYAIGSISGAQVNPAVTLGLMSIQKITVRDGALYVVAQVIGALGAGILLALMGASLPVSGAVDALPVAIAEALGAFVLVSAVTTVVLGRVPEAAAGLTIGGALVIGVTVAGAGSFAIINPAVAIGLGVLNASYLLAAIVGGVAAAWLMRWIATK